MKTRPVAPNCRTELSQTAEQNYAKLRIKTVPNCRSKLCQIADQNYAKLQKNDIHQKCEAEMKNYLPRIADRLLADKLAAKGAVLVKGAKWCGKTTTALQQTKSVLYM